MSTPSEELIEAKDCPFCGAQMRETVSYVSGVERAVWCHPGVVTDDDCLMSGQGYSREYLPRWNTRSIKDRLPPSEARALEALNDPPEEMWDKMLNAGFDAAEGLLSFVGVQKVWEAMLRALGKDESLTGEGE